GGMRGTAWANTFQTLLFMVLGVVTFFVISDRLGGLQCASEAVAAKHPSKLMREVAPEEHASYERARENWEALAKYNWAGEHQDFQLSTEQRAAAQAAYKPRGPLWQPKAEALYAAENDLLQL